MARKLLMVFGRLRGLLFGGPLFLNFFEHNTNGPIFGSQLESTIIRLFLQKNQVRNEF
jgi:hypothetical protein